MQPLLASSLPFVPALLALGVVLLVLVFGGHRMTEADAGAPPSSVAPAASAPSHDVCGIRIPTPAEVAAQQEEYDRLWNSPEEKARRKARRDAELAETVESYEPHLLRLEALLRPKRVELTREETAEDRAFDVFGEIVALMPESQRHATGLLEAAKQARAAVAAFDATAPKVETPAS